MLGGAGSAQSAFSVKSAEVQYQTCVIHHLSFHLEVLILKTLEFGEWKDACKTRISPNLIVISNV